MKLQNMVVNKWLWIVMALVYALMLSSCGNDDEPESQNPTSPAGATGIESQLLGTWSDGDISFTFLTKGKVVRRSENYWNLFEWAYNPATEILATTMPNGKGESLQCQLTLISEESWTGLTLGKSPTSFVAKRSSAATSLYNVIVCREHWLSKNKKEMPLEAKYGHFYPYYNHGNGYYEVVESREDDIITIREYTAHHPYDYENVYIEHSDGTRYYPVDNLFE